MDNTLEQVYVTDVLPILGEKRVVALLDLSATTDTLELYVALMTCLWGAWVAAWDGLAYLWFPAYDLADPSNILNLAFTFMPQWVWGMIGAMIGGLHLGTRLRQIARRRLWLLGALMFWSAVTVTVAVRVPYSTGVIAYGGLALASGLSYLRLYIIDTHLLATIRYPPRGPDG